MKYFAKELDYNIIRENLEQFPNLRELLTTEWISKMEGNKNRTNTLLRWLAVELLTVKQRSKPGYHLRLEQIEENLQNFKDRKVDLVHHFRKKLSNDEQVDDTISEINILGLLAKHYELELESPIECKKNIDSLVEIDGQKFYLEVMNPSVFLPVILFLNTGHIVPNRIKNKILDKCVDQLAYIPQDDIPALIAIDLRGALIPVDEVRDALYGRTSCRLTKEPHPDPKKMNDSIHDTCPKSDVLSAVLCFDGEIVKDGKLDLTGEIILNPNARNPLKECYKKRFEEIIPQN